MREIAGGDFALDLKFVNQDGKDHLRVKAFNQMTKAGAFGEKTD